MMKWKTMLRILGKYIALPDCIDLAGGLEKLDRIDKRNPSYGSYLRP